MSEGIRITEAETSHSGFPYALAKATFEMETPICKMEQGESVLDFLKRLQESMTELTKAGPE